jgi:hypothetical protein
MKISGLLRREKTRAIVKETVTFNAPGTYYPPYGKSNFRLQGRSSPGNPTTYNPTVPGNTVPGNYSSGGNQVTVPGYFVTSFFYFQYVYQIFTGWSGYPFGFIQYYYFQTSPYSAYGVFGYNIWGYGDTWTYYDYWTGGGYTQQVPVGYSVPTFYYTNPTYYNPTYYNPTVPGNTIPGNQGSSYTVLGVPLPGGISDSSAPVVGPVPVDVDYSTAGISISVPPGGYVSIINV